MDEKAKALREKAKHELLSKGLLNENFYGQDIKTIIEELSIYHIELEHQNEELINSQEKLRQINDIYIDIFENAPIGYVILNTENVIKNINTTACKLIDEDQNQVINSKFTKLVHPDYQDAFYFYFKGLIKGSPQDPCDIKLVTKHKSSYFFARITGNQQIHTEGNYPEFRLAISDISVQKEMEMHLIQAKEKAEENDKLKTVFLANMSHEIRTPMNGIIGFTNLLKNPKISAETRVKYVEIIQKSGNRLLDLINELINISKIEAGQMQLNLSATKISELLYELKQFFLPETNNKGLHLTLENNIINPDYKVETDKDKLYAILVNLIKNAIKYTNEGIIKFGVYKVGNQLKFFVKDTGIGIPNEKKSIVFQRFRQVEESAYHEGTGLGLSIAKGMVELLGGTVGFASAIKKGSIFFFTIPDNTVESENSITVINEFTDTPALDNYQIIVAEDDIYSSELLDELLLESRAKTFFTQNGVELMELLKTVVPDIIFLDINMPLKNGYDCLREIKENGIQTKIIAVTAYALNEEKEKILALGCHGYLSKPYSKEALYMEIEKLFR